MFDTLEQAQAVCQNRNEGDILIGLSPDFLSTIADLQRENAETRSLADRLKLEAQCHSMEARTANSTIYEIYQIISGGKGEPGNWNGAEPVRKYVSQLIVDASNHAADAETVRREREVERRRAEAAEAEVKRLRNKVGARILTDQQLADEIEAVDEACKGGFGEGGGSPGEWWYERADELEHERKYRELEGEIRRHNSRTALARTGGEHHAGK
jgi:hypothetical protein